MPACPAEGYNYTVKTDRALTLHINTCKKAAIGLIAIADEIGQRETGRQLAKRHRISSPRRPEDVPEADTGGKPPLTQGFHCDYIVIS